MKIGQILSLTENNDLYILREHGDKIYPITFSRYSVPETIYLDVWKSKQSVFIKSANTYFSETLDTYIFTSDVIYDKSGPIKHSTIINQYFKQHEVVWQDPKEFPWHRLLLGLCTQSYPKILTLKDIKFNENEYKHIFAWFDFVVDGILTYSTYVRGVGLNKKPLEFNSGKIIMPGEALVINTDPEAVYKSRLYSGCCDFSLHWGSDNKRRPLKYRAI